MWLIKQNTLEDFSGVFSGTAVFEILEGDKMLLAFFQDVDVDGQSYTMTGLKKNADYSFRVVANNKHGPGVSTEDIVVRTLSDGQLTVSHDCSLFYDILALLYVG